MNDTTGPLAFPSGDHYPAGWVRPEAAEAAERLATAREIDREQEAAARAARDNLVSERIAQRRGALEPEPMGEAG